MTKQTDSLTTQDKSIFICATLNGEIERQLSFRKNFSDQTLFRFIDSIDGRSWTEAEADVYCSQRMRQLRKQEQMKDRLWINAKAIACALTHRDKLLVEAEKSDVVICEDDVFLGRDFIELWSDADIREKFSNLNSIVLFHYISKIPITSTSLPVAEFGKFKIFKLDENCNVLSGACYYAPPSVAKRIRLYQTPISCSADHWFDMKKNGVFPHIYVLHPSPVRIVGFSSNIGYGSLWRSNALWIILFRRLSRMYQRARRLLYETLIVQK